MKITYEFADGTRSEVDVDEELGTLIINSRKEEHARCEKERYHCISLDDIEYEGLEFADPDTPESLREQTELSERINKALSSLTDIQRKRLLMCADGLSTRDIAKLEGTNQKTVHAGLEAARKKFLKNF